MSETIEGNIWAAKYGMHRNRFARCFPLIPDFPKPIDGTRPKRFYRSELETWLANNPEPREAFKIADRIIRLNFRDFSANSKFNNELLFQFAQGMFASPEQKERFGLRKIAARLSKPVTTKTKLLPDWCID